MGVVQALVSIFAEEEDKIRCVQKPRVMLLSWADGRCFHGRTRYIQRGRMKISFLLKSPLYLFCVSEWGEPEFVVSWATRLSVRRVLVV